MIQRSCGAALLVLCAIPAYPDGIETDRATTGLRAPLPVDPDLSRVIVVNRWERVKFPLPHELRPAWQLALKEMPVLPQHKWGTREKSSVRWLRRNQHRE